MENYWQVLRKKLCSENVWPMHCIRRNRLVKCFDIIEKKLYIELICHIFHVFLYKYFYTTEVYKYKGKIFSFEIYMLSDKFSM